MKWVFIAGPFRGDGLETTKQNNVEIARQHVLQFIEHEISYYSPHLNLSQETITLGSYREPFAIDTHKIFLELCHALAILPGWEQSMGTLEEIDRAKERGLPVFYLDQTGVWEELKNTLLSKSSKEGGHFVSTLFTFTKISV
ncbi:DUF4406 domain-containing protein [Candidatus Kaiserbacteria bacterium]|nr:DUF4406 domain-containing protein [Candidatus Kaiserbacteria bacterium]